MATRVIFPEWRDEHANTRYPFEDGSTLTSVGGVVLPKALFVDAILYPANNPGALYLQSIVVDSVARTVTVNIAGTQIVASSIITIGDELTELYFYDSYGRPAGLLVSNAADSGLPTISFLYSLAAGTHTFKPAATTFSVKVQVPMPQVGVKGIVVPSGELLTGEVWIVGERGVVVREDGGKLRIDIPGEVFSERQECEELNQRGEEMQDITGDDFVALTFDAPTFIKTINNEPPDSSGNFYIRTLQEKGILRVSTVGNLITIKLVGLE